jgi:hypothetical protein
MLSKLPTWLLGILIFIVLTTFFVGLSWLDLQVTTQQKPQLLPVLARIQVAEQIIYLEVPQTSEQKTKGLMYRTIVPRSRGILFEFTPPRIVEISMQNILVPLDMIFLKDEQIKLIKIAVPPCDNEKCPSYSSNTVVDQMIELGSTRALQLGLKMGDRLPIQFLDPDTRSFR